MKFKQLVFIIGIFWRGQYALGSVVPSYSHFNRKLMLANKTGAAEQKFFYDLETKCTATVLADKLVAPADCDAKNYCPVRAAGGGGGGGGGGGATTAAAAGAQAAENATEAPPAVGGTCSPLPEGTAVGGDFKAYDVQGLESGTPEASVDGPCDVLGFSEGAKAKLTCACAGTDPITVKATGPFLCPDDGGAPVVIGANVVGILKKVAACGAEASAAGAKEIAEQLSGDGGGGGGDGGPSTPEGGSSAVTVSIIVFGFTGITIALFAQ